jgi:hypothetical protein
LNATVKQVSGQFQKIENGDLYIISAIMNEDQDMERTNSLGGRPELTECDY